MDKTSNIQLWILYMSQTLPSALYGDIALINVIVNKQHLIWLTENIHTRTSHKNKFNVKTTSRFDKGKHYILAVVEVTK